ncbi:hypothetical protein [Heyndrickxia acidicola]|uniref:RNA polymerase sigma-70 region 2 domain-containing protein n=1 Tax=Heyndrickxia acidicola TaxID=209389 RepID=A0ABU6MH32_9BACI|nr:hypothetical protein [Heyndrickxia acidicola]MED1203707.1 hypothetical protein [Heyndrickxia acidicola]
MRVGKLEFLGYIENMDTASFKKCYEEYEYLLFKTALRLTGDTALAENLLFTVFRFLWETPEFIRSSQDKYISTILVKLANEIFQESICMSPVSYQKKTAMENRSI